MAGQLRARAAAVLVFERAARSCSAPTVPSASGRHVSIGSLSGRVQSILSVRCRWRVKDTCTACPRVPRALHTVLPRATQAEIHGTLGEFHGLHGSEFLSFMVPSEAASAHRRGFAQTIKPTSGRKGSRPGFSLGCSRGRLPSWSKVRVPMSPRCFRAARAGKERPAPARDPRAQVQRPQCSAARGRCTDTTRGAPRKFSPSRNGLFKVEVTKLKSCGHRSGGENSLTILYVLLFNLFVIITGYFFKGMEENESSSVLISC